MINMTYYITHIIPETLPEKNFKQITFLSATKDSYSRGILHLGYNGKREISESELSEEINEGNVVRLSKPLIVECEKHLWIDNNGKIWISDDNQFKNGKKMIGSSGIKRESISISIFKTQIQNKLRTVQRRTSIPS